MKKSLTLGQKIKAARVQAHYSQKDLAAKLKISDKAVSTYEVGRAKPTFEQVQQISRVTNKPISFFDTSREVDKVDLEEKLDVIEKELRAVRKALEAKKG